MLRFDFRRAGQVAAEGGHDFHALDGVHAEVGVQAHVEVEHLDGITGLLGDDGEEGASGGFGCRRFGIAVGAGGCGGWRLEVAGTGSGAQEVDDLLKSLERAEMFGLHFGCVGQAGAQGRHNFDALDGVYAEVAVQTHVQRQHFRGVAGLLGHNGKHSGGNGVGRWSN